MIKGSCEIVGIRRVKISDVIRRKMRHRQGCSDWSDEYMTLESCESGIHTDCLPQIAALTIEPSDELLLASPTDSAEADLNFRLLASDPSSKHCRARSPATPSTGVTGNGSECSTRMVEHDDFESSHAWLDALQEGVSMLSAIQMVDCGEGRIRNSDVTSESSWHPSLP